MTSLRDRASLPAWLSGILFPAGSACVLAQLQVTTLFQNILTINNNFFSER